MFLPQHWCCGALRMHQEPSTSSDKCAAASSVLEKAGEKMNRYGLGWFRVKQLNILKQFLWMRYDAFSHYVM